MDLPTMSQFPRISDYDREIRKRFGECIAERDNLIGERDRLAKRVEALENLLLECHDELIGYQDVKDGDYGVPHANRPMSLCMAIDELVPE